MTMGIEWTSELSVNIATVDDQHKTLFSIIHSLENAMTKGRAQHALGDILAQLVDYTHVHFACEESLFDQYDYPDKEEHKQQHAEFTDKIQAYKSQYDAGSIAVSKGIVSFVSEWIADHIRYRNKKYGIYFVANGFLDTHQQQ